MDDRVMQIDPWGRRCKQPQIQIQRLLEIVTNVLHYFLFSRSSETGYRYRISTSFLLLVFLDKFSYIEIIHPEILSPWRKTMCFVYHKSHNMACQQYSLDSFRAKHFRRYIQKWGFPILYSLYGQCSGNGVQQTVNGYRIGNTSIGKVIYLVLHQRLQRGDHNRKPMHRTAGHECGQLESKRFSSTGRKYR